MSDAVRISIGERMQALVEASGEPSKALAAEWSKRWTDSGGKGGAFDTVKSRLSNLCHDDSDGVRYFFSDPARRELLFEVLNVAQEERDQLRGIAEEHMGAEGPPARMLVDLTAFDAKSNLGAPLLALLTDEPLVQPVILILTPKQADGLPFAFGRRPKTFRVVEVADASAAFERIKSLAQRAMLVVSRQPFSDIARWAALDMVPGGDMFAMEPQDAFTRYANEGRLAGPDEVVYGLDELGVAPDKTPIPDASAAGIRRLSVALARGEPSTASAPTRLAWAQSLGVQGASRLDERAEAAVRAAGLVLTDVGHGEFADTLSRAARKTVADVALRVGDAIHIVNAKFEVSPAIEGAVTVHTIACAEPAVTQLRGLIASYTEDDWRDDPVLHRALARLSAETDVSIELLHARAWLLNHDLPHVAQSHTVAHPDAVLNLLGQQAPQIELLVHPEPGVVMAEDVSRWPNEVLARVSPVRRVLISPTTKLATVSSAMFIDRRHSDGSDGACMDHFENLWTTRRKLELEVRRSALRPAQPNFHAQIRSRPAPPPPTSNPKAYGAVIWDLAIVQAAAVRHALRRAIAAGDVEQLGDGRLLVAFRNGLSAVVAVRTWHAGTSPRAAMLVPVLAMVETHRSQNGLGGTHVASSGPLVPSMMWMAGNGIAADITFVGTSVLGGSCESTLARLNSDSTSPG